MNYLSQNNEFVIEEIVRMLEKNIAILRSETYYCSRIDGDMEFKLEWYKTVYQNLTDKLETVNRLPANYHLPQYEVKQFTSYISNLHSSINRQICEKCKKIQMASRTSSGVPLLMILENMKKETGLTKLTIEMHKQSVSPEHVLTISKLIGEVESLLIGLEACDEKLQKYIYISKIIPQLVKLKTMVDGYILNNSMLQEKLVPYLNPFSILAKLLTGELLGEEPLNPNCVLAENTLKKPVFIIRNLKRKTEMSMINRNPDLRSWSQ